MKKKDDLLDKITWIRKKNILYIDFSIYSRDFEDQNEKNSTFLNIPEIKVVAINVFWKLFRVIFRIRLGIRVICAIDVFLILINLRTSLGVNLSLEFFYFHVFLVFISYLIINIHVVQIFYGLVWARTFRIVAIWLFRCFFVLSNVYSLVGTYGAKQKLGKIP